MTAKEEYLPVPTISRDVNERPAMISGSGFMVLDSSADGAAADEVDDLDLIACLHFRRVVVGALHDVEVAFHGHPARIDPKLGEQRGQCHGTGDVDWIAIE